MTTFADMTVREFLSEAASGAPVPGGGGVAALAGALGASMASMAANFTVGKPKFAEHDALMRECLTQIGAAAAVLLESVDADAEAFSGISRAYALPRETDEDKANRQLAVQAALFTAMNVPLKAAGKCMEIIMLLPRLAETANPNLLSDVEVAAVMLEAAVGAARINVRVNSERLDFEQARHAEKLVDEARDIARDLAAKTVAAIAARKASK